MKVKQHPEQSMQEQQIREALNTHRQASTAGDANAEHDVGAVRELSHFIDGQRAVGASGRFGDVFDPAEGRVAARVPLANAAEVATAVAAAKAAFPAWSETAPLTRARLMFKFKELLDAYHDELAELITRDHGKLFSDAKGEREFDDFDAAQRSRPISPIRSAATSTTGIYVSHSA